MTKPKLDELLTQCTPTSRHAEVGLAPAALTVKIKRLHPDAVIPAYAHETDAGFDLTAVEDVIVKPGATVKVPTGLAFAIPVGYELQIRPRSGITLRTNLRVQLGTVDAGYRGEISVIVDNTAENAYENVTQYLTYVDGIDYRTNGDLYPNDTYLIRKGDRIAQGVIAPVKHTTFMEVDELGESQRGEGGFGSSGVNA
jgi:dUTP pyrophosphatase